MAHAAMAGSGANAPKATTPNSAVKAQLQMQNAQPSSNNAAAGTKNGAARYTGTASPTPVVDTAAPATATTTTNGVSNGTATPVTANAATGTTGLKHDAGLATDWNSGEQSILEEALNKKREPPSSEVSESASCCATIRGRAAEPPIRMSGFKLSSTSRHAVQTNSLVKYIKIAALLSDKTVRDVALRVRWMTKKENGKRRKDEMQNASKKSKDKKDKAETVLKQTPAGNTVNRSPMPMYLSHAPFDNDDGISNNAIGGTTGQLLEHNAQVIAQIRSNLASMKMQENTDLLFRFRDNIFAILNGMTNMPGIMSQMPPLPVKLNTELADSVLPKSTLLLQS